MLRTIGILAFAAVMGLSAPQIAYAQEKAADKGEKQEEVKKDPKVEEYEKAIKDLKRLEGDLNVYQRKKDILLELPESKLGQLLLVQPTFHTGFLGDGITAGFPVSFGAVDAFKFVRNEDTVSFVRPNLRYRWDSKDEYALASDRSFPEAILGTFRIEQSNPEKKLLLVNITSLFQGELFRLSEMVQGILGGPYMPDTAKSGPEFVKSYPENLVVRMNLVYSNPRPSGGGMGMFGGGDQLEDSRSAPLKVTYNLSWRKSSDYMPRLADPRVGFFTQDYFSVGKFDNDDRMERLINRWNLKKKDPNAAVSEPVKPIVWVIDPSIPPKWRNATKEGILYWNRAFEAIGFKNAVVVKDAPNDPDYDHADGRYNVIRWTMSEDAAYAIALTRSDPFTGEILNAGVNFDANIANFSQQEFAKVMSPSSSAMDRALQVLTDGWQKTAPGVNADAYLWEGDAAIRAQQAEAAAKKHGWHSSTCSYAHGKMESARFAWEALNSMPAPRVARDQYVAEFIRDITSHEVGHTMGLRHNFIASRLNSTKQLGDDNHVKEHGMTSSVMEYTPTNIMAVLKGGKQFFAPRVGDYDMWAIQYGYTGVPNATTPIGEKYALARIASQSGAPNHRFMTDENADSFDPYVIRFDMAQDTIAFSAASIEVASRMKKYAINNLPLPGQPYSKRTETLMMALSRIFREARFTARFVGGVSASRSYAGDPGRASALRPISPAEHRQAMGLIMKYVLKPDAFDLPESVLNSLAVDPDSPQVGTWTAPLRTMISSQQIQAYATLMSASKLSSLAENNYKWSSTPGAYTLEEHFSTLLGAVFSDLGSGKIPALRRDLQRFALGGLMTQASAPAGALNEDVRILANDALRRLATKYGSAGSSDPMTRAYIRESKAQIDRFLKRNFVGN